ncbi:MAG: phosphohistidine phosphatase [Micromonosporaceae bacterium]
MAERERPDQRTLVILRHAKADRPGGVADGDRPLTERGHADTGAAGVWLAARGYRPDVVICSPAKRTRQTWHGIAVALPDATAVVRYEPAVYESGTGAILRLVKAIEPQFGTALLIGHNPTVSLLSALLDPHAPRDSDGLRTCGMAVHRWDGSWSGCGAGRAPLVAGHTARVE